MDYIAEAFRVGGIWLYVILALVMTTSGLLLLLTILRALGKRPPAIAWWAGPVGSFIVGCVGTAGGGERAL